MKISEKEFAVIREISNNHLPDQRVIATRTGISLGLTNIIIKRLIQKGYVKAKQLNHKKIQYILTPKGFSEKAQKSYFFTLKTISLLKTTKEEIIQLLMREHEKGATHFEITANNELGDIVEIAFKNLAQMNLSYIRKDDEQNGQETASLIIDSPKGRTSIDLIQYLAQSGIYIEQNSTNPGEH